MKIPQEKKTYEIEFETNQKFEICSSEKRAV